jgi:hypothetical protein
MVYAAVNETQKRFNGNDQLGIFMIEPQAVSPTSRKKLADMEVTIGRDMLKSLFVRGLGYRAYTTAKQAVRLLSMDGDAKMLRKVLEWTIENVTPGGLINAIAQGLPAEVLLDCVNNNKPLKIEWKAQE